MFFSQTVHKCINFLLCIVFLLTNLNWSQMVNWNFWRTLQPTWVLSLSLAHILLSHIWPDSGCYPSPVPNSCKIFCVEELVQMWGWHLTFMHHAECGPDSGCWAHREEEEENKHGSNMGLINFITRHSVAIRLIITCFFFILIFLQWW